MGPVLGESSFAMAVSKRNDSPEKGWLYLCRAILGVFFFFFTPAYLPSLGHRRLLALGVYLYCVFICDWVLLSFIICIRIISSCFAKKCFPKYGFSDLRCQLDLMQISLLLHSITALYVKGIWVLSELSNEKMWECFH